MPKPYVPSWKYDVFVSYAHGDDREWIEKFVGRLKVALNRSRNIDAQFWIDTTKFSHSRDAIRDIPAALNESAVFLFLVSPLYLSSAYCVQVECKGFRDSLGDRRRRYGLLTFGNENFALACEILPSPEESVRELFPGCYPVRFYDDPQDLDPVASDTPSFQSSLRKLSGDLGNLLQRMKSSYTKVFVYPRTPGPEVKEWRETIVEELAERGYWVLPDTETTLHQQMEAADLTVFLLGERFDPTTYELTEKARTLGKRWVVWRTSFAGNSSTEPAQAAFANKFPLADSHLTFLDAGHNAGDVKREILDLLDRPEKRPISGPAKPSVYLVYKPGDADEKLNAGEIQLKCGAEFNFVYFDPSRHPQLLRESDGVLLIWGRAEESWVGGQFLAMEKVGRGRSFGLCLFKPPERMSEGLLRLIRERVPVAEQVYNAFDPTKLDEFFRPLRLRSRAG